MIKSNSNKCLYLTSLFLFFAFTPHLCSASNRHRIVVSADPALCPDATFSKIQAAVDQASPHDSIRICAGVYPEQLSISKSLDIDADSGVFIAPSALKQNATGLASGVPIAAPIFVSGADDVTVSGLTVDGINNSITECAPRLEGVLFQNASGVIDHVVVRNMRLDSSLRGCQSGTGILVESGNGGTSDVEIEHCEVHGFQKNGITANEVGTHASIHENIVTGLGPTDGAAQNGIQIGFGASGEIVDNTVLNLIWSPCTVASTCSAVAASILVVESDGVEIKENSVISTQVGIFGDGNGMKIIENRVFNASVFDGIRVEGNDDHVRENRIATADESLIFVTGNENEVAHNWLSDSTVGILEATGSTENSFEDNHFDNVVTKLVDPPSASIAGLIFPER